MALIERWITVCPTHGPARIAMPTKPEQGCWVWLNDDVHCREEVEYVLLTNAQEAVSRLEADLGKAADALDTAAAALEEARLPLSAQSARASALRARGQ